MKMAVVVRIDHSGPWKIKSEGWIEFQGLVEQEKKQGIPSEFIMVGWKKGFMEKMK